MGMFSRASQEAPSIEELRAVYEERSELVRVAREARNAADGKTPPTKQYVKDDLDRALDEAVAALEAVRGPLAAAEAEQKRRAIATEKAEWRAAAAETFPLLVAARKSYARLLAAEIRLQSLGVVDGDGYILTHQSLTPALSPSTADWESGLDMFLLWAKNEGLLK